MQKCSAPITRAYSVPADYRAGEACRGGKSKEEATVREWVGSARKDRVGNPHLSSQTLDPPQLK